MDADHISGAEELLKDQFHGIPIHNLCLSALPEDETRLRLEKEARRFGTNLLYISRGTVFQEENAKLLIDGKEVTNDYEFTADKENMEVQIEFTFDGSTLGGKQLVTFEELYDMTNPEEPKKVTEHKNINDEGQTVTIKEVPETPTPETPGTTTKTSNPPKTGDTAKAGLWLAIAALSAMGVGGAAIHARKKKKAPLAIEEKKEESEDE
ncbi:MAG: VaFE repeat-containing surface-anchored protein [Bacteroidales bacterium]|nr:VaFE repeat-containing surface-anchored protein [Bacteroidales bacterium]